MKARSQFDEGAHPAANANAASIGLDQAIQHLQERAFPGPVCADKPQTFATAQLERNVIYCPELACTQVWAARCKAAESSGNILQAIPKRLLQISAEAFGNTVDLDEYLAHGSSSYVPNRAMI